MRWSRVILSLFLLSAIITGCILVMPDADESAAHANARTVTIEATAYCPCGSCCGWHRNWLGRPVISKGKNRGTAKAVGITASGTKARPGTIAADKKYYPFGTIMYVPGYGYGRVEDTGGDITGPNRIDLYYNTHKEALHWGRKKVKVLVYPPGTPDFPHRASPPR